MNPASPSNPPRIYLTGLSNGQDFVVDETAEQWLHDAVDELPEPLQNVIRLVYFQELKYREAAEALNIPVGTVKSRMHAAVAKLNEAWNHSQSPSS